MAVTVHFAALFIVCSLLNVAASHYPMCLPSQPSQTIKTDKFPTDIAYDPYGDKLYVAYWEDDVVDIFNKDGSKDGSVEMGVGRRNSLTSVDIDDGACPLC